jgi:hypothetical protein
MKLVEWSMQGVEVANCNCNHGCPCQFNSLPTKGNCRAYTFVQIEKGHFDGTPLDGLRWGILASWPGPIHLGQGAFQTIIDGRANERQRSAIEAISHGRETEPGTLIWQVFSTTVTNVLPTLVKNIDLAIDLKTRTAKVNIDGLVDATVAPIKNPVTGADHHARVTLPNGFEFTEAEYASGRATARSGPIELIFDGSHAHMAKIHWSTHGVVR